MLNCNKNSNTKWIYIKFCKGLMIFRREYESFNKDQQYRRIKNLKELSSDHKPDHQKKDINQRRGINCKKISSANNK